MTSYHKDPKISNLVHILGNKNNFLLQVMVRMFPKVQKNQIALHHDNAPVHSAKLTTEFFRFARIKLMSHPLVIVDCFKPWFNKVCKRQIF